MSDVARIVKRLEDCPTGKSSATEYEATCIEALTFLFVPPLQAPKAQAATLSRTDRRDAVFPNRNMDSGNNWGRLYQELQARIIVFEFKNYGSEEIGKGEVIQTRSYMSAAKGRLAFVCGTKTPNNSAHIKRNNIYSQDGNVILFLTTENIKEMLYIKERGDDPSDFIMDLLEYFYIQHE